MSQFDVMFGHFRRYRRHELVAKVTGVGGEVEVCRYFDFAGIFPWLFLNKLMGASTFNRRLIEIYDKFVVPVSRIRRERCPTADRQERNSGSAEVLSDTCPHRGIGSRPHSGSRGGRMAWLHSAVVRLRFILGDRRWPPRISTRAITVAGKR